MTRTAAVAGCLLAIVVLLAAVPSGSLWWIAGVLLLVAALGTLRRNTLAQLTLCALGVVILAWALPTYFRGHQLWPFLAVIGLAAITLGLGLLGFLLDRYQVPEDSRKPL
jgi:hypothetical protein